jgi:hypothetical protein
MCTVTVVPYLNAGCPHGGRCVRVACNRDEQRSRPSALPPQPRSIGDQQVVFPVDPASGGTWIAVSDAGLALVLLNVNDGTSGVTRCPRLSRGTIIPSLLGSRTLTMALARLSSLEPMRYAPFRLLVLDRLALAEVRCDGETMRLEQCVRISKPFLFTSSGLGDSLVEGPRGELFAASFDEPQDWLAQQEGFHRHRWADRPEISVCMSRPEARTVSYSDADLTPEGVSFTYQPESPDQPGEPERFTLLQLLGGAA